MSLARKTYRHKHYLTKINRHKQYQYYFSTCCGRPLCRRQYLPRELSEQRQRQEAPVSIASTPPAASIIAAVRWKTATHRRCRSIPPPLAQKQRMSASISATPADSLPRRATSRQIELAGATDASEAPLHPPTLAQKQLAEEQYLEARPSAAVGVGSSRGKRRMRP